MQPTKKTTVTGSRLCAETRRNLRPVRQPAVPTSLDRLLAENTPTTPSHPHQPKAKTRSSVTRPVSDNQKLHASPDTPRRGTNNTAVSLPHASRPSSISTPHDSDSDGESSMTSSHSFQSSQKRPSPSQAGDRTNEERDTKGIKRVRIRIDHMIQYVYLLAFKNKLKKK